jgi:beta-mannosidase
VRGRPVLTTLSDIGRFAQCGQYPCHPDFRKSVEKEARDQLTRLRHHACIVVYAGNNEDYQVSLCLVLLKLILVQIAEGEKLDWDSNDNSGDWTKTTFRA